MKLFDADVAIIGSGFSGSILAWILASRGRSVALIDVATHPRFAIGESSTPIADLMLRRLGVRYGLESLQTMSSYGLWQRFHPEVACGRKRGFSYYVHQAGKEFTEKFPNTTIRVVKAMLRAAKWLDENDNANRPEAVEILSRSEYVGADYDVIANSMTGTFEYEKGDKREVPDFNVFFRYFATYPYYSDAVWYLTQMRRWGQIAEPKSDDWYFDVAKSVYRPDIYQQAAEALIEEGEMAASDFPTFASESGFRPPQTEFIDDMVFDGTKPNAYLEQFPIGLLGDQVIE